MKTMNLHAKGALLAAMLGTVTACSQIPLPTPSPQSPNSTGGGAPTRNVWSNDQAVDFMQGLDEAIDDMFVFQPTPQSVPSTQQVHVVSACSGFFASDGNIAISGTFSYGNPNNTQDTNSFNLSMAFNSCQLQGQDQNDTYTYDGNGLLVSGTVTSVTDANGVTTHTFANNQVSGLITLTTASGSVPCQVDFTNTTTFMWSNNVRWSGHWSGTLCGVAQNGNIGEALPVVDP